MGKKQQSKDKKTGSKAGGGSERGGASHGTGSATHDTLSTPKGGGSDAGRAPRSNAGKSPTKYGYSPPVSAGAGKPPAATATGGGKTAHKASVVSRKRDHDDTDEAQSELSELTSDEVDEEDEGHERGSGAKPDGKLASGKKASATGKAPGKKASPKKKAAKEKKERTKADGDHASGNGSSAGATLPKKASRKEVSPGKKAAKDAKRRKKEEAAPRRCPTAPARGVDIDASALAAAIAARGNQPGPPGVPRYIMPGKASMRIKDLDGLRAAINAVARNGDEIYDKWMMQMQCSHGWKTLKSRVQTVRLRDAAEILLDLVMFAVEGNTDHVDGFPANVTKAEDEGEDNTESEDDYITKQQEKLLKKKLKSIRATIFTADQFFNARSDKLAEDNDVSPTNEHVIAAVRDEMKRKGYKIEDCSKAARRLLKPGSREQPKPRKGAKTKKRRRTRRNSDSSQSSSSSESGESSEDDAEAAGKARERLLRKHRESQAGSLGVDDEDTGILPGRIGKNVVLGKFDPLPAVIESCSSGGNGGEDITFLLKGGGVAVAPGGGRVRSEYRRLYLF